MAMKVSSHSVGVGIVRVLTSSAICSGAYNPSMSVTMRDQVGRTWTHDLLGSQEVKLDKLGIWELGDWRDLVLRVVNLSGLAYGEEASWWTGGWVATNTG